MSTFLSLVVASSLWPCALPDDELERRNFKNGRFSVVMPKAFALYPKHGYAALTSDSVYLVDTLTIGPGLARELQRAQQKGPEATTEMLNHLAFDQGPKIKITKTEAGGFHGMPCSRRWLVAEDGSKGVETLLLVNGQVYVLLFASTAGELDLKEAQRMFDSFRLEPNVTLDSPLCPRPESHTQSFGDGAEVA